MGCALLGAGDGAEGIEVLGREPVDVVVLDIMMPRVDGWMTLMEIRSSAVTANLPVIMLTAKTQDLAKIYAFKQGVQQYVTKPFNVMELSARVESLAKSRRKDAADGGASSESEFRKLAVRKGGRTVLLSIDDIVFVSARNKSTYAHTYENQYSSTPRWATCSTASRANRSSGPPQLPGEPQPGEGDPPGRGLLRGRGRRSRRNAHPGGPPSGPDLPGVRRHLMTRRWEAMWLLVPAVLFLLVAAGVPRRPAPPRDRSSEREAQKRPCRAPRSATASTGAHARSRQGTDAAAVRRRPPVSPHRSRTNASTGARSWTTGCGDEDDR